MRNAKSWIVLVLLAVGVATALHLATRGDGSPDLLPGPAEPGASAESDAPVATVLDLEVTDGGPGPGTGQGARTGEGRSLEVVGVGELPDAAWPTVELCAVRDGRRWAFDEQRRARPVGLELGEELQVRTPPGWTADPPRWRVDERTRSEVRLLPIVPLRVVDRDDGRPVPELRLQLGGEDGARADGSSVGTTDSEGLLMPDPWNADWSHVRVLEGDGVRGGERPWLRLGAYEPGAPRRVPVDVGPIFDAIVRDPEGRPLGAERVLFELLDPERPQQGDTWRPGRAGGPDGLRVRFEPRLDDPDLPHGPTWTLCARDTATGDAARVELPWRIGGHVTPVELRLTRLASLQGRVLDANGQPLEGALLDLWREGVLLRKLRAPAGGAYHFAALDAGAYRVRARHGLDPEVFAELELAPGEHARRDLRLVAETGPGRLSGVVRSRTGRYRGALAVRVGNAREPYRSCVVDVAWSEEGGAWVGHWSVAHLPLTDHEVELLTEDVVGVEPATLSVRPEGAQLEHLVLDGERRRSIRVDAFARESGVPLDAFEVRLELEGVATLWGAVDGWVEVPDVPESANPGLWVASPGYRPLDQDGCEWTYTEEALRLTAALERGWGTRLVLRRVDGSPAVGVPVELDGERVGVTDSQGVLDLARDAVPRELRLVGERPVGGDHDPRDGTSDLAGPVTLFVTEPEGSVEDR